MPVPDFIVELRRFVGHRELWLPGVTAVVVRGTEPREVLLVQRSDTGEWTPVTGIPEPGEEPAVAAVREVLEEAGVHARAERLVSTGVSKGVVHVNGDRASYLDLTFRCAWVSGEPHGADDETTDARWCPVEELPPMRPQLRRRIDDALAGESAARFSTGR